MASPSEWYASLPPITKIWGVSCFAATAFFYLGLTNPMNLALIWPLALTKFQARRERGSVRTLAPFSHRTCETSPSLSRWTAS